jgi:hypothetical protein
MGKFDGPSRCSGGQNLKFRWYGFPQAEEGRDFDVVLEKFQAVIEAPNRITHDYVWIMAKAEIKQVLKQAAAGKLQPPDQLKPVDVSNPPPLYEIRWQSITVRTRMEDGRVEDERLLIRMYHSEPHEAPTHFIGHHIHEKAVDGDSKEIRQWQDTEIKVAVRYFEQGKPVLWGISELTNEKKSIN